MAIAYLTVDHLSTKDLTRIFSKISIKPDVQWASTPCWIWTAHTTKAGYGRIQWQQRAEAPHRLMYARFVERLLVGSKIWQLDHLCRNRACCNPAHLELVTNRVNSLRGTSPAAQNAKRTECIHGHPLTGPNLHITKQNTRRCRECGRAAYRRLSKDVEFQTARKLQRIAYREREREYARGYYYANKAKVLRYNAEYTANHRAQINQRQKERRKMKVKIET